MTDIDIHSRVVLDPIYGLVKLYEFELLIINLKMFQRLRRLLQAQGASYVYPSAVHSRLSHSIGALHIATVYADSISETRADLRRRELLRLAALLHDVGHGIFSHCYDEIVYPHVFQGQESGHDAQRHRIVLEYMPDKLQEAFNRLDAPRRDRIKHELRTWGFLAKEQELTKEVLGSILSEVHGIWGGEEDNSVDFNIIQGPLGADRMDFLLRDAYFAGTPFGKVDYQRIIHFASIETGDKGIARLCYQRKTFDSIIAFLLSKFLMYFTVYYHKTTRAADRMVKELLEMARVPLGLVERTRNLDQFQDIDETRFFEEVSQKVYPAQEIVNDLFNRRLFKVVDEFPYTHDYSQSSVTSEQLEKNVSEKAASMVQEIRRRYEEVTGEKPKIRLYEDTPYELKVISPLELASSKVFMCDPALPEKIVSFDEAVKEKGYNPFILSTLRLIRIYARESDRRHLQTVGIAHRRDVEPPKPLVDTKL